MNIPRISQLYHPHIDKPMTDSNFGVPLKRLTSTASRVNTVHCNWTRHWEHADFSLAKSSSSAYSSSNSVLSSSKPFVSLVYSEGASALADTSITLLSSIAAISFALTNSSSSYASFIDSFL